MYRIPDYTGANKLDVSFFFFKLRAFWRYRKALYFWSLGISLYLELFCFNAVFYYFSISIRNLCSCTHRRNPNFFQNPIDHDSQYSERLNYWMVVCAKNYMYDLNGNAPIHAHYWENSMELKNNSWLTHSQDSQSLLSTVLNKIKTTELWDLLYRYVWSHRVWFFSHFGYKQGIDFS